MQPLPVPPSPRPQSRRTTPRPPSSPLRTAEARGDVLRYFTPIPGMTRPARPTRPPRATLPPKSYEAERDQQFALILLAGVLACALALIGFALLVH